MCASAVVRIPAVPSVGIVAHDPDESWGSTCKPRQSKGVSARFGHHSSKLEVGGWRLECRHLTRLLSSIHTVN